jgi:hypothetical protein
MGFKTWHAAAGGGGSINYTMMHESSEWLSQHLGAKGTESGQPAYWDKLKHKLGEFVTYLCSGAHGMRVSRVSKASVLH